MAVCVAAVFTALWGVELARAERPVTLSPESAVPDDLTMQVGPAGHFTLPQLRLNQSSVLVELRTALVASTASEVGTRPPLQGEVCGRFREEKKCIELKKSEVLTCCVWDESKEAESKCLPSEGEQETCPDAAEADGDTNEAAATASGDAEKPKTEVTASGEAPPADGEQGSFSSVDVDDSGEIDYQEFAAAVVDKVKYNLSLSTSPKALFTRMGKDLDSGHINKVEWAKAYEEGILKQDMFKDPKIIKAEAFFKACQFPKANRGTLVKKDEGSINVTEFKSCWKGEENQASVKFNGIIRDDGADDGKIDKANWVESWMGGKLEESMFKSLEDLSQEKAQAAWEAAPRALREVFEACDEDGGGSVDFEEFKMCLKDPDKNGYLFKQVDKDRNGDIDKGGWGQAIKNLILGRKMFKDLAQIQAEVIFNSCDVDGGGSIDLEEFKKCLKVSADEAEESKAIEKFNAIKDGQPINKVEWNNAYKEGELEASMFKGMVQLKGEAVFRACDVDGGGDIDLDEFKMCLKVGAKEDENQFNARAEEMFRAIDTDDSKKIDQGEWVEAYKEKRTMFKGLTQIKAEAAFKACDADENGSIDFAEFKMCSKVAEDEAAEEFKAIDKDGSGEIDKGEWAIAYRKDPSMFKDTAQMKAEAAFRACDVDGGGSIDLEEFKTCLKADSEYLDKAEELFKMFVPDGSDLNQEKWVDVFKLAKESCLRPLDDPGCIYADMFKTAKEMKPITQEAFFSCMDLDGNGNIDKDEFAKVLSDEVLKKGADEVDKEFKEIDKDDSGEISKEEWKAAEIDLKKFKTCDDIRKMYNGAYHHQDVSSVRDQKSHEVCTDAGPEYEEIVSTFGEKMHGQAYAVKGWGFCYHFRSGLGELDLFLPPYRDLKAVFKACAGDKKTFIDMDGFKACVKVGAKEADEEFNARAEKEFGAIDTDGSTKIDQAEWKTAYNEGFLKQTIFKDPAQTSAEEDDSLMEIGDTCEQIKKVRDGTVNIEAGSLDIAEGALATCGANIKDEGRKASFKELFKPETLFTNTYFGRDGPIMLTASGGMPGMVFALDIEDGAKWFIQPGALVAGTPNVETETTCLLPRMVLKGCSKIRMLLEAKKGGVAFLVAMGHAESLRLKPDEQVDIDPEHLLAFKADDVKKFQKSEKQGRAGNPMLTYTADESGGRIILQLRSVYREALHWSTFLGGARDKGQSANTEEDDDAEAEARRRAAEEAAEEAKSDTPDPVEAEQDEAAAAAEDETKAAAAKEAEAAAAKAAEQEGDGGAPDPTAEPAPEAEQQLEQLAQQQAEQEAEQQQQQQPQVDPDALMEVSQNIAANSTNSNPPMDFDKSRAARGKSLLSKVLKFWKEDPQTLGEHPLVEIEKDCLGEEGFTLKDAAVKKNLCFRLHRSEVQVALRTKGAKMKAEPGSLIYSSHEMNKANGITEHDPEMAELQSGELLQTTYSRAAEDSVQASVHVGFGAKKAGDIIPIVLRKDDVFLLKEGVYVCGTDNIEITFITNFKEMYRGESSDERDLFLQKASLRKVGEDDGRTTGIFFIEAAGVQRMHRIKGPSTALQIDSGLYLASQWNERKITENEKPDSPYKATWLAKEDKAQPLKDRILGGQALTLEFEEIKRPEPKPKPRVVIAQSMNFKSYARKLVGQMPDNPCAEYEKLSQTSSGGPSKYGSKIADSGGDLGASGGGVSALAQVSASEPGSGDASGGGASSGDDGGASVATNGAGEEATAEEEKAPEGEKATAEDHIPKEAIVLRYKLKDDITIEEIGLEFGTSGLKISGDNKQEMKITAGALVSSKNVKVSDAREQSGSPAAADAWENIAMGARESQGSGSAFVTAVGAEDLMKIDVTHEFFWRVQKGHILAATSKVDMSAKQVSNGTDGGGNVDLQQLEKKADVEEDQYAWIWGYGHLHRHRLVQGEELVIDDRHFVAAMYPTKWAMEKKLGDGELLLGGPREKMTFKGPGEVVTQSKNIQGFVEDLCPAALGM